MAILQHLGEIIQIENNNIKTNNGAGLLLDSYHLSLPFRKGDSVLLSKDKILFMIPRDNDFIEKSITNPISGISPIFAKLIISGSLNYISKNCFSPDICKDKVLSCFFNMIAWNDFYFSKRGLELEVTILNKIIPSSQIKNFLKYWFNEHLIRQFQLWGLSLNETKILIEDIFITNPNDMNIEDLILLLSKYPGRFLYTHPDIDDNKIKHLTHIFGANDIPESIRKIKREIMNSSDSFIIFTKYHKESIGKNIGLIGKYGLISFDNDEKIAFISTYKLENYVSKIIASKIKKCDYNWENNSSFKFISKDHDNLTIDQKNGIKMVFTNNISVITGGPGTGKTKLIHGIIKEAISRGVNYHVAAFTGKASGRVKEIAYPQVIESSTLDMMLVQGPGIYKFNLLILEEASMITTKYMYRLFQKFNPLIYSIVMVGDLDQIPPIDKGHFFSSLIWSKRVPYIRLTKNFRINNGSDDIIRNAYKIIDPYRNLKLPIELDFKSNSFNILKGNIGFLKSILKTFHKSMLDCLTIMSPYNSEVNTINKIFQDIKYNIGGSEKDDNYEENKYILYKGNRWYIGDRIMTIENNISDGYVNGDLGTIVDVNENSIIFTLDKDNNNRTILVKNITNILKHSYCFTINKSQGSEYDGIILYLPLKDSNDFFLNMNLIYTAITRARKIVWIIVEDPIVLINACNKRLSIPKDILKDNLIKNFPDKEYKGDIIEEPIELITNLDDEYDDIDLNEYY